jgi:subtilisin family serine protease
VKERHIILRATGLLARDRAMLGGPTAGPLAGSPTDLSVDVEDLEQGKADALRKKADVLAVAPAMPLKLVEPIPTAAPLASGIDWGVTAVRADSSPFSGDGVTVAILDTGIDPTHPAFAGVTLVQQNFTDDADGNDAHGHGTNCAGTIFGRDVDGTRIGVARGVKRALIGKVLGSNGGPSDAIVNAIQWAVQGGANVISMSLGMDFPGFQKQLMEQLGLPAELATSKALEGYRQNVLLFERLASLVRALSGMRQATIIIAAAGNESRTDQNPNFKIAVSPPAVAEGIISVAALGQSGAKFVVAPFSNTGAVVSGPGVDITSANLGGGLTVKSGTSMATPHVAGVAALWAQKLQMVGPLNAGLFSSRLVASGVVGSIQTGFDPADVGSGMVQAPQS